MLDREHSIIALRSERGHKISPEVRSMAVAQCAIHPYKVAHGLSGLHVERPLDRQVVRLNPRIFGVDIAYGSAESPDDRKRVHSLEEEMTGIQVRCDDFTNGRPQALERRNIVNTHARMQLETEMANSFSFGYAGHFKPKGND